MKKKRDNSFSKAPPNQLSNFFLEKLLLPQEQIEACLLDDDSWGMMDIAQVSGLQLRLVAMRDREYDFSGYELDEWKNPVDDPCLLREYPFIIRDTYRIEWTRDTQIFLDCLRKPAAKRYGAKGERWLMEFWQAACRQELAESAIGVSIIDAPFHLCFDSYREFVIALTVISGATRDAANKVLVDKDLYRRLTDLQKVVSKCPTVDINGPELAPFEQLYTGRLISCEKNILPNSITYRLNISDSIFYYDDDFDSGRSFSHCEELAVGERVIVFFTKDKKLGSVARWIVQPSRVVLAPIQKYRLSRLAREALKPAFIVFLLTLFIFLVDLPKYPAAAIISIGAIISLWGLLLLTLLIIESVLWIGWGRAAERTFHLISVRAQSK